MSTLFEKMEEAQQNLIEYMAFGGGGAKGAIYSGAYAAVKESGMFDRVKAVAGSSAGAITAALAATSTTPKKFEEISKNTNLQSLLGEKGFSAGPIQINKDGKPLYDLLDVTIRENVGNFLQKNDIINITDDRDLNELRQRCEKGGKIYFKDIALLQKYDPLQYKDLVITAVRKDIGELTIFNSIDTPDVEIALACRASASIPLVFEPVKIDGHLYVDGGYRDNIPIKYFPKNEPEFDIKEVSDDIEEITLAKKQGRTLAMVFGSGAEASANIAIYSAKKIETPSEMIKFIVDVLFKAVARVGGKFKYTETRKATSEELRENALNTVVLDAKGVDTLDFNDAQKYADYLHIKGYCQTKEYLSNHELGKEPDKTFEHQKFLLNVYETYNNENLNKTFKTKLLEMIISPSEKKPSKWQDGIIENQEDKAKILLSFCESGALSSEQLQTKLKEFVVVAGATRNNKLQENTKAIKALIYVLNDPTTPDKIKEDFKELLTIDKNVGHTNDNSAKENTGQFKFTPQDFKNFLDRNKSEALKLQRNDNRGRG